MGRNNNVECKSAAGRRAALLEAIALLTDRYTPKSDRSPSYGDRYNNKVAPDEDDDDFHMYEFKVRRCMRGRSHDWTDCPFAHPGEKALRRDPRRFHYSGTPCPDYRKGSCKRGESCEYSHGVFECWLHPSRYRTQVCKDGMNCKRRVCFFAHSPCQLRLTSHASMSEADLMLEMTINSRSSSPISPQNSTPQAVTAYPFDVSTHNFNNFAKVEEQSDTMLSESRHHMLQATASDSFVSSSSGAMASSLNSSGGFYTSPYLTSVSQNVSLGNNVPDSESCLPPSVNSPQNSGRNIFTIPQMPNMATMGLPPTTMDAISGLGCTDSLQMSNYNNNSSVSMNSSPAGNFHTGLFVGDSTLESPFATERSAVGSGSFNIPPVEKTMPQSMFSGNVYGGASVINHAASSIPAATYRDVALMRTSLSNQMDQNTNNDYLQQLEAQLASKLKLHTTDFVYDHEFGFPSPTSTLIPPQGYSPPQSPLSSTNSDKAAEVSVHVNDHDSVNRRNIVDIMYGSQTCGLNQVNGVQFARKTPIGQAIAPSVASPLNIQQQRYVNLHNSIFEMDQLCSPSTKHFSLNASPNFRGINDGGLNSSPRGYDLEMNPIRRNIFSRDSNMDQNQVTPDVDWVTDLVN